MTNRLTWLEWLLILAVIITPRVVDLDVFFGRDELTIWTWADEFTLAVRAGDPAGTLTQSDYPGIPMFWVQTAFLSVKVSFPALFQGTLVPLDQLSEGRSLDLLAERRLAGGLFISLQLLACVWLVRRLFGRPVALLSAIFLGLDPFSLTEARLLRLEMMSALFATLSILTYLVYLRGRQRRWLLVSGLLAGLGVSSKTSAGLIVPFIWLLLLLDFLLSASPVWLTRLKRMIADGLVWAAAASGMFWLIWPAMWVKPLAALRHVFLLGLAQAANRSVWGENVFFWGQVIEGGDPGPTFYPVVFAFRTTPLTWLGLAGALIMSGLTIRQQRTGRPLPEWIALNRSQQPSAELWRFPWPAAAVALLLAYMILVTLELSFIISKVDRFLLLVFPILNIVSALGLAALIQLIIPKIITTHTAHPVPRTTQYAFLFTIALILALQLSITLPAHPYYFTYWNPWAGGGRTAMDILPLGSGEGIDEAMDFLNHRPNAAESSVVCGASWPWCSGVFKGETYRSASFFDGTWITADYAALYISHLQREQFPPEIVEFFQQKPPLYQVDFGGATYVWLYEVPQVSHFAGRLNDLAGVGRLLGYDLEPALEHGAGGQAGTTIEASLWWVNRGGGVDNLILRLVDETAYEWSRAPVIPLPEYAQIPAAQDAVVSGAAALTIPPGTPPGLYFLRIGAVEPGTGQLVGEFTMPDDANQIVVLPGRIFTNPAQFAILHPADAALAPDITLLGYAPPEQVLTADLPTWLTLTWQATARPADYVVELTLVDAAGAEITRWQGRPGHDHYPTIDWQAGEIVRDVWALQVPSETPPGLYDLELRLRRTDGSASSHVEMFKIKNLEVWPQPVTYEVADMQAALGIDFGDRLTLLGYDLYFDADGLGGGSLAPVFYWQSQSDMEAVFDLGLTLRAADSGQVTGEWHVPLGRGARDTRDTPKRLWKSGEVVTTIYRLEAEVTPGQRYHLDLSLASLPGGQLKPVTTDPTDRRQYIRIEDVQDKIVVRVQE